ncbi:DUF3859 domain-containing protein [Kaarinaea lacus]
MSYKKLRLLLATSVVLIPLFVPTVNAENKYKSEVTEFGYYRKVSELERERNIATTTGFVRVGGEVELEQSTNEIPLKLNRLFGFKFRIEGFENKEAVQLKLVVSHPEITRPNGSTSKGYSYPVLLEVNNGVIDNHSGYSIDHEYEMVEGDWTFEYWYNDQKLLSHSFKTVNTPDVQEDVTDIPETTKVDDPAS